MGFVAVLGPRPEDKWSINVVRVHLNLWCIRRRVVGHALMLDIGVGFHVLTDALPDGLELFVPVAPEVKDPLGVEDLVPRVREQPAAQLIFGEPVEIQTLSGVTKLMIDDSEQYPLPIVLVETDPQAPVVVERNDLWRIHLPFRAPLNKVPSELGAQSVAGSRLAPEPTPPERVHGADVAKSPGVEFYARFRLHIGDPGGVWTWKRQGFLLPRAGAVVDLRVADLRDPVSSGGVTDEGRVLNVELVNTFVVTPQWLQQKGAPKLTAVRLLEGANWQGYLNRKLNPHRRSKSVVYYQRDKDGASKERPANTFIDLGREVGLGWRDYAWLMALAGGAMAVVAYGPDWINDFQAANISLRDVWDTVWEAFDGLGRLLGIASTLLVVVGVALGAPRRLARLLRRFERDRLAKP